MVEKLSRPSDRSMTNALSYSPDFCPESHCPVKRRLMAIPVADRLPV
ncbi:MAG: hypothetical protein ABIK68_16310 [bacterium]